MALGDVRVFFLFHVDLHRLHHRQRRDTCPNSSSTHAALDERLQFPSVRLDLDVCCLDTEYCSLGLGASWPEPVASGRRPAHKHGRDELPPQPPEQAPLLSLSPSQRLRT